MIDLELIYSVLPLSERTLVKRYKTYSFDIRNDRGVSTEWWIYREGRPVAVVVYYKGRKLCMYGYNEN